ncbi:hypothetical protein FG91_04004 [Sphingopyxis sp. LC81]|uniref:hypothetical protein n=1 Tax=Sphingopyxis sp. LC81 TaxID=1502850 RepID=UPI00050FBB52|nr:hypothetical protein [Sphingopyxis sp. LC81]KGB51642.1 hypothetical protein FG91_04004 [Sphingopyxis sp. LC81]
MRELVSVAALLLMACSSGDDQVVTNDGLDGRSAGGPVAYRPMEDSQSSVKIGADNQQYPKGFSPYPGSRPARNFSASVSDGGTVASFEVEAKVADVMAHFRKQAEAQGMKITGQVEGGSTTIFVADRPDGSGDNVKFTIIQSGDRVMGAVMGK